MSDRRKQISETAQAEASFLRSVRGGNSRAEWRDGFIAGAEWADANAVEIPRLASLLLRGAQLLDWHAGNNTTVESQAKVNRWTEEVYFALNCPPNFPVETPPPTEGSEDRGT